MLARLAAVAALLLVVPANAKVLDSQPYGMAIQHVVQIAAPPDKVYAVLIKPNLWWSSAHTFSGDAANLSLEPRAGGCWCEKLANGGSVQHAVVVFVAPNETLRTRGPFGPFQGEGVDGALTFTLKAKDGGTELTFDSITGGYMKGGFGQLPAIADGVFAEQLARLKSLIETGNADKPKEK